MENLENYKKILKNKMDLKDRTKLNFAIKKELEKLEKEGKLSIIDNIVQYGTTGWDQLERALGFYNGPLVNLILVDKIEKEKYGWRKRLTFGKATIIHSYDGDIADLEKIKKEIEFIKKDFYLLEEEHYSLSPSADLVYQPEGDPNNLIVIRSKENINFWDNISDKKEVGYGAIIYFAAMERYKKWKIT